MSNEPLLERADELRRVGRVLDAAAAGEGGVVVVAGPSGLGKTKLLEAAEASAVAKGARPLPARAGELEHDFAFGVVRQLLEAPVLSATGEDRRRLLSGAARHAAAVLDLDDEESSDRDIHTTLHGLYWLLVNLSAGSPLLLAVDDLQWVDEPSLRWLAYAARRLEGVPVVLAVTVGPRVESHDETSDAGRVALAEIVGLRTALRLEPAPLSALAVAELLQNRLGRAADAPFATACLRQTGGNPFLLSELAAELAAGGIAPTAEQAAAPAGMVPEQVGASIRRRLARVSRDARALAAGVAVLGDGGTPAVAARLSGMDGERAARAAAELVAVEILVDAPDLRFRHPLLRAAVADETPALERADLHGRAARLLAEQGAPAGRTGAHLLASAPGAGDGWVVDQLRSAAHAARRQGVPEQAAALLRRALAEPPPTAAARRAVLSELGTAELDFLHDDAAGHLRAALDLTGDGARRAELAVSLGLAEYQAGRHGAGVDAVLAAIEETRAVAGLREQWLRLEALLALVGRYDLATEARTRGRVRALAERLAGTTPGERLVRVAAESEDPGPTADDLWRATRNAERAEDERPWPGPAQGIGIAAMYLHAGRPQAAASYADSLLATTREAGSPPRYAIALACRALVSLDLGDLRAAGADLDAAFELWGDLGERTMRPASASFRALTLAGLGELDRAEALLAEYHLTGELPPRMVYNPSLFNRGLVRLAQRRFPEAEADFRELGRRHATWGMTRPSPPWRSGAALALIGSGAPERARELATAELGLVRVWDTPKAISLTTRVLALTATGDEQIEGLSEAVDLLEGTPWRLDRARARLDLGSSLRRAGRRRAAREALTLAMDEAHACGAAPLAERAAGELRASGARPRRRAISGLDALTPSERRVSELAAAGRTNREIAQELFVTLATVETHLTRAYRKLDVPGRDGLAAALSGSRT